MAGLKWNTGKLYYSYSTVELGYQHRRKLSGISWRRVLALNNRQSCVSVNLYLVLTEVELALNTASDAFSILHTKNNIQQLTTKLITTCKT